MSKVQEYLNKKKQTPVEERKFETPQKSPYMDEIIRAVVESITSKMKTLKGEDGKNPSPEELIKIVDSTIEKKREKLPKKEEILRMIASMIPKLEDGKTPQKGKDYFTKEDIEYFLNLSTPVKGKHYFDGAPGRPGKNAILPSLRKLAINTINVIEMLEGEDRLDAKAIKNLRKIIKEIVSQETIGYNAGGPGIIFHDSTLSGSGQPGDPLKAVSSLSSVIKKMLTVGSGTSWTLPSVPNAVILLVGRGQTLYENATTNGYSISGITLTTTDAWSASDLYIVYV